MGSRFASELLEHVVDLPQQKLLPLPAPHQLQMDQSFSIGHQVRSVATMRSPALMAKASAAAGVMRGDRCTAPHPVSGHAVNPSWRLDGGIHAANGAASGYDARLSGFPAADPQSIVQGRRSISGFCN
ncbi:hypothetical protein [Xanthomonas oryzae]|uniref:hypothetical protein n=1 Tax=Xanthomonas oryzae TaxID=347 RepID=UPI001FB80B0E|nr:hypothetical protein [Xanthomonas oryzae]